MDSSLSPRPGPRAHREPALLHCWGATASLPVLRSGRAQPAPNLIRVGGRHKAATSHCSLAVDSLDTRDYRITTPEGLSTQTQTALRHGIVTRAAPYCARRLARGPAWMSEAGLA